jgi:hypothetical protein
LHARATPDRVLFEIEDQCGGIPPDRCDHLLEQYSEQGNDGTGLGLWVTRGIVEKHEGTIHFTSTVRPGRSGTAFSVFLPFEQVAGTLDMPKPLSAYIRVKKRYLAGFTQRFSTLTGCRSFPGESIVRTSTVLPTNSSISVMSLPLLF